MSSNPQFSPMDTKVTQICAGSIVPVFLSSFFVLGRLYTRAVLVKNWGWDDTFITISWLTNMILACMGCYMTTLGFGHHRIFIPPSDVEPSLLMSFICRLTYQFVLFIVKLGMCIFYLRVFQDRTSKMIIYSIMGFLIATFIPVQLLTVFMCTPVAAAWSVDTSQCMPRNPVVYLNATSNIITDIGLMAFVIPRILQLSLGRGQKLSLLAVFSLGVLVVIAAIVRLVRFVQDYQSDDFSYVSYDIPIWSTIEACASLFCASAPCLRPLVRRFAPRLVQSIWGPVSSLDFQITPAQNGVVTENRPSSGGATNAKAVLDLERQEQGNVLQLEGKTTSTPWTEGPRFEIGPGDDEYGSESGIMNRSGRVGDTTKTVGNTVPDGLFPRDEQNVSRENSTMSFEHV